MNPVYIAGIAVIALLALALLEGVRDARNITRDRDRAPQPVTWSCHFCGLVRPDARISVGCRHRQITTGGLVLQESRRYCNDSPACIQEAYEWTNEPGVGIVHDHADLVA